MHHAPAFRSLTRRQRKLLGWPERKAREWVQSVGPDARGFAEDLVDEYVNGPRDSLDGPTDEPDPDGQVQFDDDAMEILSDLFE